MNILKSIESSFDTLTLNTTSPLWSNTLDSSIDHLTFKTHSFDYAIAVRLEWITRQTNNSITYNDDSCDHTSFTLLSKKTDDSFLMILCKPTMISDTDLNSQLDKILDVAHKKQEGIALAYMKPHILQIKKEIGQFAL